MPLSLGALPRTQNIVGQWLLDEASGVRYDQTANNNDLQDNNTVTQGTGHEGGADKCASFASANTEYLSITDALQTGLDGMTSITITFWMNTINASGPIVCKGTTGIDGIAYVVGVNATPAITFQVGDSGGGGPTATSAAISTGTWYHVACRSIGSGKIDVFINGAKSGADANAPGSIQNNAKQFTLGTQDSGGGGAYNGLLDEVVVWNVALTDDEIKQVAQGSAGGSAMAMFL